jgi:hypothetical protein
MTSLPRQEYTVLLQHFEHAYAVYMHEHIIDGQPCTSRRYSAYNTIP